MKQMGTLISGIQHLKKKNLVIPPTIEVLHLTRIFVSLINKNNLYVSIVTTGFVNLAQLEISGKNASVRGCLRWSGLWAYL